jgi:hypothetical protein
METAHRHAGAMAADFRKRWPDDVLRATLHAWGITFVVWLEMTEDDALRAAMIEELNSVLVAQIGYRLVPLS